MNRNLPTNYRKSVSELFDINIPKFGDHFFHISTPRRGSLVEGYVLDYLRFFFGIEIDNFKNFTLQNQVKTLNENPCKQEEFLGKTFWELDGLTKDHPLYKAYQDIGENGATKERLESLIKLLNFYDHKDLNAKASLKPAHSGASRFTVICGKKIKELLRDCPETFNGAAGMTASRFGTSEGRVDGKTQRTPAEFQVWSAQGEEFSTCNEFGTTKRLLLDQRAMAELSQINGGKTPAFINLAPKSITTKDDPSDSRETIYEVNDDATFDDLIICYEPPAQVAFCSSKENDKYLDVCAKEIKLAQIPVFAINFHYYPNTGPHIEVAKKMLKTQLLGTVQAAHLNGHKKIFLTGLGLGVFENKLEWYLPALKEALEFAKSKNMDVGLIVLDKPGSVSKEKDLAQGALEVGTTIMGLDVDFATTPEAVNARFR